MAPSNICNCERIISQFTAKSKLLVFFMLLLLRLSIAQFDTYNRSYSTCGQHNLTNGSALERNLKLVLNLLVKNVNETGYDISWYGENGDKMYALLQCRGDLDASSCRACASRAGDDLREICNGSSGSIHLGLCFLKYATQIFDSRLNSFGNFSGLCQNKKLENARGLDLRIANLLTRLVEKTVSTKVVYSTLSDYGFYSLAECWRALSMNRCSQCLNTIYTNLSLCPAGTDQGTVLNGYCMIQFTGHKFYRDHVPPLSPPSGSGLPVPPSRATEGKAHPKTLGWSIGGAVLLAVLVGVVLIWKIKVMKTGHKKQLPGISMWISLGVFWWLIDTLINIDPGGRSF